MTTKDLNSLVIIINYSLQNMKNKAITQKPYNKYAARLFLMSGE
jgi:patatin-like phospholipase/acyl hydrolase